MSEQVTLVRWGRPSTDDTFCRGFFDGGEVEILKRNHIFRDQPPGNRLQPRYNVSVRFGGIRSRNKNIGRFHTMTEAQQHADGWVAARKFHAMDKAYRAQIAQEWMTTHGFKHVIYGWTGGPGQCWTLHGFKDDRSFNWQAGWLYEGGATTIYAVHQS